MKTNKTILRAIDSVDELSGDMPDIQFIQIRKLNKLQMTVYLRAIIKQVKREIKENLNLK